MPHVWPEREHKCSPMCEIYWIICISHLFDIRDHKIFWLISPFEWVCQILTVIACGWRLCCICCFYSVAVHARLVTGLRCFRSTQLFEPLSIKTEKMRICFTYVCDLTHSVPTNLPHCAVKKQTSQDCMSNHIYIYINIYIIPPKKVSKRKTTLS